MKGMRASDESDSQTTNAGWGKKQKGKREEERKSTKPIRGGWVDDAEKESDTHSWFLSEVFRVACANQLCLRSVCLGRVCGSDWPGRG